MTMWGGLLVMVKAGTKFWKHAWLEEVLFWFLFPRLFSISKQKD